MNETKTSPKAADTVGRTYPDRRLASSAQVIGNPCVSVCPKKKKITPETVAPPCKKQKRKIKEKKN